MASTYWITFKIGESGNAEGRYQALLAKVRQLTHAMWWTESANFLLFDSDHDIEALAAEVATVLDLSVDLALIARDEGREARAIGATEDPWLFELMPFAQQWQPPHVGPEPGPKAE